MSEPRKLKAVEQYGERYVQDYFTEAKTRHAAITSDPLEALKFWFGKAFMRGRNDTLSTKFKRLTLRCFRITGIWRTLIYRTWKIVLPYMGLIIRATGVWSPDRSGLRVTRFKPMTAMCLIGHWLSSNLQGPMKLTGRFKEYMRLVVRKLGDLLLARCDVARRYRG